MQISGLSASNTFSATDVLAIEVNVNGVEKTYKLTGATLAAALASIGSYLKMADVVNNLTSGNPNPVSSGAVYDGIQQATANIPLLYKPSGTATTNDYGIFTLNTGISLSSKKVFVLSNYGVSNSTQYNICVETFESSGYIGLRVRKYADGTAVANTTIDLTKIALIVF